MENLWDLAKLKALQQNRNNDWPYIMQVYRELGGMEKSIHLFVDGVSYELIGESENRLPLVREDDSKTVLEMEMSRYLSGKRLFKSYANARSFNPSLVPIQKLVTRRNGTSFMQTFYVTPEEKKELESKKILTENEAEKYVDSNDENFWRNKTAELTVDVAATWRIQCNNLYRSNNLGALAVRESLQNSRDAVLKAIKQKLTKKGEIKISTDDSTLTIEDNGVGMDTATLHTKFLELGGTTKGDNQDREAVGGFGQAKAVILGCGNSWEIHTKDNYFDSRNLGRGNIQKASDFLQGTRISIRNVEIGKNWRDNTPTYIADDEEKFKHGIMEYILSSDIPNVDISYNGEILKPLFVPKPENIKNPTHFGISLPDDETKIQIQVYPKEKDGYGKIYVRLGGLTQFTQAIGYDAPCDVVLDIDTKVDPRNANYPFSNNRESLKGEYLGMLDKIRDTVKDNPKAVVRDSKYRETYFDNTSLQAKEQRSISTVLANFKKDILDIGKVSQKLIEIQENKPQEPPKTEYEKQVWEAEQERKKYNVQQGIPEDKHPSLADKIKARAEQIEQVAKIKNITEEEAAAIVDKHELEGLTGNGNPLDYAWLCWETSDRKTEFKAEKHIDCLVVWDSICRMILQRYPNLPRDFTFYPGFILDKELSGLSVCLPVNNESRNFTMFNPETVNTSSDFITASYLKIIACHELAHAIAGNHDKHGENHSYTREFLDEYSLDIMDDLVDLVKKSGIRKKLDKIKKDRVKAVNKELEDVKWAEMRKRFAEVDVTNEAIPESKAVKDAMLLMLHKYFTSNPEFNVNDSVRIFDPQARAEIESGYTVSAVGQNTLKLKEDYGYNEIEVPISKIIHSKFVDSVADNLRAILNLDYYSSSAEQTPTMLWAKEHLRYNNLGVLALINRCLTPYHVSKKSFSDDSKKFNLIKNLIDTGIQQVIQQYPKNSSISTEAYITDNYQRVFDNIDKMIRVSNKDFYYNNWYYTDSYDSKHQFIKEQMKKYLQTKAKDTIKKQKNVSPKKESVPKAVSQEQQIVNANLKSMSNQDLEDYAQSLGVDVAALKTRYPEKSIQRMRLTMAAKKAMGEKLEVKGGK